MTSNSEHLIGEPAGEVPKLDPDEKCNARRADPDGKFIGYCGNTAGLDTDHEGEGRCAEHGGSGGGVGPTTEAGKLKASRNSATHNLTADPFKYHETVDDGEEADFVVNVSHAIENRIDENTGEVDFLDEVLARQMAIQFHVVAKASNHFAEEGLFERIMTPDGQIEVENRMLEHIRQYNKTLVSNLEKIGAVEGSDPDFDAVTVWRSQLE